MLTETLLPQILIIITLNLYIKLINAPSLWYSAGPKFTPVRIVESQQVRIYLLFLSIAFITCCCYLVVINFTPPRTTWNNYTPVNLLTAELLCAFGGCLFLILFKKTYFLPTCAVMTNKQNFAESMGNSSSVGGYSPGYNTEESNVNSTETLNKNLEKYPATAKKDTEQVWSSTMEIAKAGAKGCVTGASLTSAYNKDYRACVAGATLGAAWYTKDAAITQLNQSLNRGLPIEQTIKMERQWETNFNNEETKKDE